MRFLRAAVIVCSVVLGWAPAGCAVKQPPPATDALAGVLPQTTTVPLEWRATTGKDGEVVTAWVETFNDAQLEALIDEGLRNNLDLKAAVARIDVAGALATAARSLLYPQIALYGFGGTIARGDRNPKTEIAGRFSWELDLWGRVRAAGASAEAEREATEADLLSARQSIAALVATLWYETIATERLRATAEAATVVYADLLKLVQVRNDVGQVGQQDVALAGADLDRARQKEREFATSEQQIARSLEVVLGRYPANEVALAPDLPPTPPPVPDGLPSELLERRPDLVAAERRVAAAFHDIQVAKAARLPRLALTAEGGRQSNELLRILDITGPFWWAGAELLAPIFTGGALKAGVRLATAEQEAAVALFGQTALRAFSEVEGSLASEQTLADQQRYLESVLTQDTEALRLGRIRYEGGATDLLHVLQMQARQLTTQFDLIAIRNERLANRIALHLALGGGFAPAVP